MRNLLFIIMPLILIVGCSENQPEKTQVSKPVQSGMSVSSETFGKEWPFTVNSGVLDCVKGSAAIFKVNGKSYQLNGVASSLGFEPIDKIWKDNPETPGAKINTGPMISLALKQC
ncbi:hypothetical protein BZG25_15545 [Salinivibrio sp. ML198]|uniref:DUF2511 domain-containing protein n=1 Tax=Salinivibrio sp. ML198 TaxID=1909458 RepID=UPI0009899D81|nr:DUF2511 domain-containing protein [Salinivibrio sp. ML198]OOE76565.1 hypothetical protein BZG25_15545 [Salinivibrio sp. ML198]